MICNLYSNDPVGVYLYTLDEWLALFGPEYEECCVEVPDSLVLDYQETQAKWQDIQAKLHLLQGKI